MLRINAILEYLLYSIIFSYFFLNGNAFAGLGIHNWLIILFDLLVLLTEVKTNQRQHYKTDKFLFTGILFSGYAFFITAVSDGLGACVGVLKIVFFTFFAYGIAKVLSNEKIIDRTLTLICVLPVISSVCAIGQENKSEWAYQMLEKLHPKMSSAMIRIYRPSGLCSGPIEFSYMLSFASPICLARIFFRKQNPESSKLSALFIQYFDRIVLGFVVTGVWINQSRSTIIASGMIIFLCLYEFLFVRKGNTIIKLLVVAGIVTGLFLFLSFINIKASRFNETDSAGVRLPLFLTGINYFLHNPMGGGAVYTPDPQYFIDPNGHGGAYLYVGACHNIFANALVCYGIVGGLYILYVYFGIAFRNTIRYYQKNKPMNSVLLYMMSSYFFNSLLHNAYILNGEAIGWCIIGFIIGVNRSETVRRSKN